MIRRAYLKFVSRIGTSNRSKKSRVQCQVRLLIFIEAFMHLHILIFIFED